jgi:hypothetical protein
MLAFLTGESEYRSLEFIVSSQLIFKFYFYSNLIEVDLVNQ